MEDATVDVRQHLGFLLEICALRGTQFIASNLEEFNLSPHGYYILLSIVRKRGLTQKQLSEYLSLNVNTVTRLLDSLEQKGYAKRVTNQDNRKENLLEATPLGERKVKLAFKKITSLERVAYVDITDDERGDLYRILTKLFLSGGPARW
jgi:DNA-binding MarR family transcriptional regulator